jgi:hypothetical protein
MGDGRVEGMGVRRPADESRRCKTSTRERLLSEDASSVGLRGRLSEEVGGDARLRVEETESRCEARGRSRSRSRSLWWLPEETVGDWDVPPIDGAGISLYDARPISASATPGSS